MGLRPLEAARGSGECLVGIGLPRLLDPSGECLSILGDGAGEDEADRAGEGRESVAERGVEGRLSPGEILVGRAGRRGDGADTSAGGGGSGVSVRECFKRLLSAVSSSSVMSSSV